MHVYIYVYIYIYRQPTGACNRGIVSCRAGRAQCDVLLFLCDKLLHICETVAMRKLGEVEVKAKFSTMLLHVVFHVAFP